VRVWARFACHFWPWAICFAQRISETYLRLKVRVIAMSYSSQSRKVRARAQRQVELSKRVTTDFLNAELELTRTLTTIALNSFADGNHDRARRAAATAKEGYDTVRKFLPKLKDEARKPIEAKLATLDPLIVQLAAIK
jgi:hypothetical protein